MKHAKTIGLDVGDKAHAVCVLDAEGNVELRERITNTSAALQKFFSGYTHCVVALEASTHSPWISRELTRLEHRTLVAQPRRVRLISDDEQKCDERDAEHLARLARVDPQLLHPIRHRGEQAQADLASLKARDGLVRARSLLINLARSLVKGLGARLPACSAEAFARKAAEAVPALVKPAVEGLLTTVAQLTQQIQAYDRQVQALLTRYPEAERMDVIPGVGPLTTMGFLLTIEEPQRFRKSRHVGPFLGLVPRRDQSGNTDKRLGIHKRGNAFVRRLLISCAHYILGPHGPDTDLRRFGLRLAERGGRHGQRRAVVAVARKLAVLMHHLWSTGAPYAPLRQAA
jgi:transposase